MNFVRMSDDRECLLLKANNLPSAFFLSSVQTTQKSSENVGLMRYRGDFECQVCENVGLLN